MATAFVIVGMLRGVAMQHFLEAAPLSAAQTRVAEAIRALLSAPDESE
jgi:hypothetical protein